MELQEFISESLTQILDGVDAARRKYLGQTTPQINPPIGGVGGDKRPVTSKAIGARFIETVYFDVAVTVTEGTETKAGIGVVTGIFGVGAKGSTAAESSSVSRLKFGVPVVFPYSGPGESRPTEENPP